MVLLFSIHYFLWYGALTSIFGYESVYARHYTHATTMQYGYLNMVLPYATVVATPMICSLADRQRSHRSYFTISLVLTTIALAFYALLPIIMSTGLIGGPEGQTTSRYHKTPSDQHPDSSQSPLSSFQPSTKPLLIGPWVYYCLTSLLCDLAMGINTCLSDSFAVLQAEEQSTNFGRIIVWGTFGWASSALVLAFINQWTALPRLMPGLIFGTVLLAFDVVIVTFWRRSSDFKLDLIPIDAAQTLTGSSSSAHKEPSDYLPFNESARINLGPEVDEQDGTRHRKTRSPLEIIVEQSDATKTPSSPSLVNLTATVRSDEIISENNLGQLDEQLRALNQKTTDNLSPYDSLLASEKTTPIDVSLKQTLSSSIPKSSIKNEEAVKSVPQQRNSAIKITTATGFKMQLILLGLIMQRRKTLIRYFILFILSGFFMSMHWNYFFLYLEKIFFEKFELISALSMVGQSLLGELPFFIVSHKLIGFLGRSHTLSMSVISIGLRFLIYNYFLPNTSMYFIFLADCFQGPNYGLFYVVMTEVGLEYSFCDNETIERLASCGQLDRNDGRQVDAVRLSLKSTVQSVAFACYEGIGVGLGSLAGGWIVASYGFETLWLSMAVGSISVGIINIWFEYACRESDPEQEGSERHEFMEARRKGILRKLNPSLSTPVSFKTDLL